MLGELQEPLTSGSGTPTIRPICTCKLQTQAGPAPLTLGHRPCPTACSHKYGHTHMYNLGTHVSRHTHQHTTKCMPHTETHILIHRLIYVHTGTHAPTQAHTADTQAHTTHVHSYADSHTYVHTQVHMHPHRHTNNRHTSTHIKTQTHTPNSLTYIFSSYMGTVCPAKESSFLPGRTSWSLFFQRCSLTQKGLRKMWKGFGFGFLGCLLPREDCRTQGWAG